MVEFADLGALAIQLAAVAVVVETLTQVIKTSLKETKVNVSKVATYYLTIVLGIVIAVLFNISLFVTENTVLFYVGTVICGAIASRGGNHIHDILKGLASVKDLQGKK